MAVPRFCGSASMRCAPRRASSFKKPSASTTEANAAWSGYPMGFAAPPSLRTIALFRRHPGDKLGVGDQIGVDRGQFPARALLQLDDACARPFADAVDLHDRLHVLEHGNALLERCGDHDLQAEILVESHHLPLVLAVHLGEGLVEDRKRHA